MPFILFIYFARKEFSVMHLAIIPITMCVLSAPCLIMGRNIKDIFMIYLHQTNDFAQISMNYSSFWVIISDNSGVGAYAIFKVVAIILTISLLGVWMIG